MSHLQGPDMPETTPTHDFNEDSKATKTDALIQVLKATLPEPPKSILVVGCGSGREAGMLARTFAADVVGIDVGMEFDFDHAGSAPARLMIMDARDLSFPDGAFDFVFSFHALEHIPSPEKALAEMARVLKPGGAYLIGTPNRSRMFGYIGSPIPVRTRILWNVHDLWMRLTGRWSNEAGAHAGFSRGDLQARCSGAFGTATDVSDAYYRELYAGQRRLIDLLASSGLSSVLYPCVYVSGRRRLP